MGSQRNRYPTGATRAYSMLLGRIGRVAPVLFLLSCSSVSQVQRESAPPETESPPRYSLVYIIHGDGGYGYHDSSGGQHRADEEALAGAQRVAELNDQAEVFIFHERRRRRFLRLFWPLRDGRFFYYRSGRLLATESYRRGQGPSRYDPEVALYNRFRAEEKPGLVKMLLYFGHEIPEFGGTGYDASHKKWAFTVDSLAGGMKRMTNDSEPFDLMMLSTCFNGTPYTVSTLAPYARYIIASPDNLHLSYFDTRPLEQLDVGLPDGDVSEFATTFAHHSFDRLTSDLQTAVTVAVYDVDRVLRYLSALGPLPAGPLTADLDDPGLSLEHYDCAENPEYALPGMSEGVEILYRPARFGRSKHKREHSGWECVRAVDR